MKTSVKYLCPAVGP